MPPYAKLALWLGILSAFGLFCHVLIRVLSFRGPLAEFFTSWEGLSLIFLSIIAIPVILLAMFFWTALMLLIVDIGRNLRAIHKSVRS